MILARWGVLGPGYHEREMNLQIAKRVEKKLKAKGAKVVRLKTEEHELWTT